MKDKQANLETELSGIVRSIMKPLYSSRQQITENPDAYVARKVAQITALFAQDTEALVREAREDELERFTHWYYFDRLEGRKLPIENYRDERIAALQQEPSQRGEK